MDVESFVRLSPSDIARQTGIALATWSRYLNNKKGISENTLNQAGEKLGMSPHELLRAINIKRNNLTK